MTLYDYCQQNPHLMNRRLIICDHLSDEAWDGYVVDLWRIPVWDRYMYDCNRIWRAVSFISDESHDGRYQVTVDMTGLILRNHGRLVIGRIDERPSYEQFVQDLHVYFSGHMNPVWFEAFATALSVPDMTIEEQTAAELEMDRMQTRHELRRR